MSQNSTEMQISRTNMCAPVSIEIEDQRPAHKLAYTKGEAAQMLSLEETSINWLLRKGALPHRKIAGKIRFTRADLQALIEGSAVTRAALQLKKVRYKI